MVRKSTIKPFGVIITKHYHMVVCFVYYRIRVEMYVRLYGDNIRENNDD